MRNHLRVPQWAVVGFFVHLAIGSELVQVPCPELSGLEFELPPPIILGERSDV